MKPVRLPASATLTFPRIALFALCVLYIVPGLVGRDLWKTEDAAGFGIMWTMAHGTLNDWLWPNIAGLPVAEHGPLAFWAGAVFIKLFGWVTGDVLAARLATAGFFLLGAVSVWRTTYLLGRRGEAQPLRLAFGGQPEPSDYGRTLADGALLIYLGCLGLALHSHATSAGALQISLVASILYFAARLFDDGGWKHAVMTGIVLGLLALTRGWIVPVALWVAMLMLAPRSGKKAAIQMLMIALPIAAATVVLWMETCALTRPYGGSPFDAWMDWNYSQIGMPNWPSVKYIFKNAVWFAWPAWPFAGWAVYAWRRQGVSLHVVLPLALFAALLLAALLNPVADEGVLLPLLPSLAILAAFGLPTMKRGAINAVDWFSVMTLSTCAVFIWLGWIAKQSGWPAQLAKNAFKLAPGFKPEFNLIALLVAAAATVGWIMLVKWRISRRPSVLWRAVVLSSGGVILCWLLLMTLWLPWINYGKSYAGVARDLASAVGNDASCVDARIGTAQRASFAYFGNVHFAGLRGGACGYFLVQDNNRDKRKVPLVTHDGAQWQLIWEGHRPSDRDERYRLYRRLTGTS